MNPIMLNKKYGEIYSSKGDLLTLSLLAFISKFREFLLWQHSKYMIKP